MIILEESDLNEEALTSIHETLLGAANGAAIGAIGGAIVGHGISKIKSMSLKSRKVWKTAESNVAAIKVQLGKNPNNPALKTKLVSAKKALSEAHARYKKESSALSISHRKQGAMVGAVTGGFAGHGQGSRVKRAGAGYAKRLADFRKRI